MVLGRNLLKLGLEVVVVLVEKLEPPLSLCLAVLGSNLDLVREEVSGACGCLICLRLLSVLVDDGLLEALVELSLSAP